MADFFDDPRYPERPQHPDFYRLMDVVNRLDGETTEGGRDAEEVLAQMADPESVRYMAFQRGLRLERETGIPAGPVAAIWLDGFAAGVEFQQAGGHRDA